MLGAAESFVITGALSWGLGRVDPMSAGQVIAWIGMAMFAALALGAPIGTALYAAGGFAAVALATTLVPLATLLLVAPLRARTAATRCPTRRSSAWPAPSGCRASARRSAAWASAPSSPSARCSSPNVGGARSGSLSASFAASLIAARVLCGHLPDRLGGAKVALVCALVEAAGLALIWLAPGRASAAVGAGLAGFGYSLVYPGLGVEAVRRAPPQSRGLAMGAYTACLDLALGLASPALGLIAGVAGLGAVFLAGALVVLGAAAVAARLIQTPLTRT